MTSHVQKPRQPVLATRCNTNIETPTTPAANTKSWNLTYMCCTALLVAIGVMQVSISAVVLNKVNQKDKCNLFYNGLENLTMETILIDHINGVNDPISLPISKCACPVSGQQPVFIAPFDLCQGDSSNPFGSSDSQFCHLYGTLQHPTDHVLTCMTEMHIDYMWTNQRSCHNPNTTLPFLHRGYLMCATSDDFDSDNGFDFGPNRRAYQENLIMQDCQTRCASSTRSQCLGNCLGWSSDDSDFVFGPSRRAYQENLIMQDCQTRCASSTISQCLANCLGW